MLVVGNTVFAGTDSGEVYVFKNIGDTWTAVDDGMAKVNVCAFAVSGKYLLAATWGGGVWRRPLSDFVTSTPYDKTSMPKGYSLEQNYPNP